MNITKLSETLGLKPGVTTIIGSGGKTSLMYALANEIHSRTVICTSTRINRPEQYPVADPSAHELRQLLKTFPVLCTGTSAEHGKLAAPSLPFELTAANADYVIVEGDGSKHLPLKAHASHEPVIPMCSNIVLQVVGLSGIGKPISEVCHRPQLFAELCGCSMQDIATPERTAMVIEKEALADIILLNQADLPGAYLTAAELSKYLSKPVYKCSIQKGEYTCLH